MARPQGAACHAKGVCDVGSDRRRHCDVHGHVSVRPNVAKLTSHELTTSSRTRPKPTQPVRSVMQNIQFTEATLLG